MIAIASGIQSSPAKRREQMATNLNKTGGAHGDLDRFTEIVDALTAGDGVPLRLLIEENARLKATLKSVLRIVAAYIVGQ